MPGVESCVSPVYGEGKFGGELATGGSDLGVGNAIFERVDGKIDRALLGLDCADKRYAVGGVWDCVGRRADGESDDLPELL